MNTVYLMYVVIVLLILAIIYVVSKKTKEAFSDLVYVKGNNVVDIDKMIDDIGDKEVLAVRNYLLPRSEVHAGQLMPFNPQSSGNNVMPSGEVASTMIGPEGSQNQQLPTQNMGIDGIMNSRKPQGGPKPFDPETVGTIGAPCQKNEDCESNFCGSDQKCSTDPTKEQVDVSEETVDEETSEQTTGETGGQTGGQTDGGETSEQTTGETVDGETGGQTGGQTDGGETSEQTTGETVDGETAGMSDSIVCNSGEFLNTNMSPIRCGDCKNCETAKKRAIDQKLKPIDCSVCENN